MSGESYKDQLVADIGYQHRGGNFILDKGIPKSIFDAYVDSLNKHIQVIKLGWTTWALFGDDELQGKLEKAGEYKIPACLGGTLFEISHNLGKYQDLLDFLRDMRINTIEIASGFSVDFEDLPEAIRKAKKQGLEVMVEVGYKDQEKDDALTIDQRVSNIKRVREEGADYVVLEAREMGSGFSVFKEDAKSNNTLIEEMLKVTPIETIVFEAPSRANQIFLVNTLGPNVNMGNIPFDEIPRVETIRRGLHADTFQTIQDLKKGI